jgi:hypothetical protein
VWTEDEDEVLTQNDARATETLDSRHGYGAAGHRKVFLQAWKKISIENKMNERSRREPSYYEYE